MNANSESKARPSLSIRVSWRPFAVKKLVKLDQACVVGLATLLATSGLAENVHSRLADAAEKADRATIRALLKERADVNAPQADGMTALHWAARLDDLEIARLLVKASADVKSTNHYGVAPLS